MSAYVKKEVTPFLLRLVLSDDCSEVEKETNSIASEEVMEAIKGGKAVEIINAVIEGPFILKSINIEGDITIKRTKIRGIVDCTYVTFKCCLSFENSIFENDASFIGATVEKDIFLNETNFQGNAFFSDLAVRGVFYSWSTIFEKESIFYGTAFKKGINFNRSVFKSEANFGSVQIGGNAEFTKALFKERASFNGAHIKGGAFFKFATFESEVGFVNTRIAGGAEFIEALFKKQTSFNGAQIGWGAFFDSASFEEEADFGHIHIMGSAEFDGAMFEKQAIFNSAKIEGDAFFNSATFKGDADFLSAQIGAAAEFNKALFKKQAIFSVAQIKEYAFFNSATFDGNAKFEHALIKGAIEFDRAEFKEQVNFNSAQIKGDTSFKETVLDNDVSFQNTSFKAVFFLEPKINEKIQIDLRGCIYDRIHPISFWKQLMEHLSPYDRQPFYQLEETFRQAGKDNLADDVYYMGRRREFIENKKFTEDDLKIQKLGDKLNRLFWLLKDWLLYLLTGYGVRLKRLIWFILFFLVVGTFIFHLEGAVVLSHDIQQPPVVKLQDSYIEAFWVSLNIFLPVEIPSGANWIPSSRNIIEIQTKWGILGMKFTSFATLLKLAGWILIPIGLAGISGILKRSR